MSKKEKKKSKKRSKRSSDEGTSKDCTNEHQHIVDEQTSSHVDGTNTSIPLRVGVNLQSNVTSSWSWGAAFAAAATIRPNDGDLDEEFLRRTNAPDVSDGGVSSVAQLAQGYNSKDVSTGLDNAQSRDKESANLDEDNESDGSAKSEDVSLEGRMVSLSKDSSEQSMVLVDKQSGKVYSSGARLQTCKRLVIGKLHKGNIKLDKDALKEMKKLEESEEQSASGPTFPYATNPDDHCETPLESYQDILPILDELSKARGGKRSKLRIYDPYYCNGSVVKHLESLGYTDVYNRKEDCYAVWELNKEPNFDVLLTNPPYSEDHIEKLMKYLTSPSFGSKPFLLLMPQWVHKKDYYINATTAGSSEAIHGKKRKRSNDTASTQCSPFYIVPKKRYVYLPPPDFRERKVSDVHKKSSPFISMWFVWGGSTEMNERLMTAFRKSDIKGCELARSRSALRDLRRGGKKKAKRS
jgi:hypothetical protein